MSVITPRARPQLGDEAASYIRDQITSGTLAPGAHVRPEVVAAELGISSTPAREALQALRAEGFLELAPRKGFTVARVTGADIRDIFLVQATVSGELAGRAAKNMTPEQVAQLERIHHELIAAAERNDVEPLEGLNHEFHRLINLAADAPKLSWVVHLVSRYAPRRFYASIEGWPQTTVEDHTGVMEAIRAHDAEAAAAAMREHVNHAGELLARHVDLRTAEREAGLA